jgi:hypothetical protein
MIIDHQSTSYLVPFPWKPLASTSRKSRIFATLVFGVSIFNLSGGCSDRELPAGITKRTIAFTEVPAALTNAAKKEIPGIEFNEAWQNLDPQGKLHSYEIRGRQPSTGKIREVRISLDGAILESE